MVVSPSYARDVRDSFARFAPAEAGQTASAESIPRPGPIAVDPSVVVTDHAIAPGGSRLLAESLDLVLSFGPALAWSMQADDGPARGLELWAMLLSFAAFFLMIPLSLWISNGRTPGKFLLNTRVVRADGTRITFRAALKREILDKRLHHYFFVLDDLTQMLEDGLRRSAHDCRSKTFVVTDRPARADH